MTREEYIKELIKDRGKNIKEFSASTLKSVYQHTFTTEREIIDKRIDDYFNSIIQHEMQHET